MPWSARAKAAALTAEGRVLPAVVLRRCRGYAGPARRSWPGGPPRRVTQATPRGPVTLTTVRDPDGVLVLLTLRFDYQKCVTRHPFGIIENHFAERVTP